jgi:hypothetical protein
MEGGVQPATLICIKIMAGTFVAANDSAGEKQGLISQKNIARTIITGRATGLKKTLGKISSCEDRVGILDGSDEIDAEPGNFFQSNSHSRKNSQVQKYWISRSIKFLKENHVTVIATVANLPSQQIEFSCIASTSCCTVIY